MLTGQYAKIAVDGIRSKFVPLNVSHDPLHYLDEAARCRKRAAAIFDNAELRDSYLALARSYEWLADALGRQGSSSNTEPFEN